MRKIVLMAVISVLFLFSGWHSQAGEKEFIEAVKGVYFTSIDKNITIGKAFDTYKYFNKTNWKSFQDSKGRNYVEFRGSIDRQAYYRSKPKAA